MKFFADRSDTYSSYGSPEVSMLFKFGFGNPADERHVSVDIGTSAMKVMELDFSGGRPLLVSAASGGTPAGAIQNNLVTKPEIIGGALRAVIDANEVSATRATFSIPGPCVFTKRIQVSSSALKGLEENIAFEAANYIPHKIDAVHLDHQVLRSVSSTAMEVLLVAVKNEIISSYLEAIELAGLEPMIADIDYFALENMFEVNYPEEKGKTLALVNIGARYTSINIIQDGLSIFTGDVGIGGRLYTDALCEQLQLSPKEAELAKMGQCPKSADPAYVTEMLDRTTDHVASELHRQLGFYWNAAATDRSIEVIFVGGGSSVVPGLIEELTAKTGIDCRRLDCFRGIDHSSRFDPEYLTEIAPSMAVSVGLALRRLGDKRHASVATA